MSEKNLSKSGIIKALGLVFGDIGTSPIYTVTVVFLFLSSTNDNILGVLSLIVWTLLTLVTVQYAWLAMSLSKRGEGGTIVLKEILQPLLRSKRSVGLVALLSIIGVSLLIGDGVITPAISILSAVEGSLLIPGLEGLSKANIVFIAALIAIVLFTFQRKGTEKIAGAFGPVMSIWFISLTLVGIFSISEAPDVLKALNPYWGIKFLLENGFKGFIALGEIILCATGGEALYADMGHLGGRPIRQAWIGVFFALVINYLGQGAFLVNHPEAKNILFEMVFHYAKNLYVPFLILSISATVIASQAMISGMFSIVYQGITTRLMPIFKVDYTSVERRSQIYIGSVNWFLLAAVLFIMLEFMESHRLAAAYGLAVTGTMFLTGILMTWIFYLKKKRIFVVVSLFATIIDVAYLSANFYKIPHGGYWSLLLASIPLAMIIFYTKGQKRLYGMMDFMHLDEFLNKFTRVHATTERIKGTALFLIRDIKEIPFYITQTMFFHGIIYEDNIFVSIIKRDDPFGIIGSFKEDIAEGLRVFEIQVGYMEVIDVEEIMRKAGIEERVVFYGLEDIATDNIAWKIFSFIKRATPTFIQFYKFPPKKLHGVFTKVWL
ncbi:MAG: potassium transporter Kup [Nitrospirae bacterium CG_4_10_14_0_8_um_filter_41_23]|nr:KUP/HAK/KT family potassium transporter [Nitrospirota bacterium]OIP60828.1 MAG: potassium transporter Kup [Nitrospirae bacterium CG2_30_41_42]PIQ94255.1 MAG: potassium transporter Kup [Nitrospirae bacterium CG11_big_fil_rev_8_21_14_0_20_41_14]PIV43528.1 MAG: potassium transporter Kup [Nitrospirae bacterium CG02_land_8_20_14_3_00_41_53]PIW87515.1 MAG: potassium transporter Kup [Nitrospirae bacterium CG_4_8_14_3_um_filter_41_47]PIY87501.1 MAG: potassium transporter Kup [Nitrospirae bacterium 